jgi:transposase
MNRQNVTKWVREFREGRKSVHDEERSGLPSLITDDFIQKVEQFIHEDRCLTLDELLEKCPGVY